MTRNEFFEKLARNFMDCLEIVKRKNADYATEENPLSNFEAATTFAGIEPTVALLVRIGDKWTRYRNLMTGKEPAVQDESIEDTLRDVINYTNILLIYHQKNAELRPKDEVEMFAQLPSGGDWFKKWAEKITEIL